MSSSLNPITECLTTVSHIYGEKLLPPCAHANCDLQRLYAKPAAAARVQRLLSVSTWSIDPRHFTTHRPKIRAELPAVMHRMFNRHCEKVDSGCLNHSEQVEHGHKFLPGHGAHAIKRGGDCLFVTDDSVIRAHDAAGVGVVWWRCEGAIRDAVQVDEAAPMQSKSHKQDSDRRGGPAQCTALFGS